MISFLLPWCWCVFFGLSASMWCGGLFLACPVVLHMAGGVACPVFVSATVWACVVATLNLRTDFCSGVWIGCLLCFAVVAVSIVSMMVLGCGWGCGVGLVYPWVADDRVVGTALRQLSGSGGECLWRPLCWLGCPPGGVLYLASFFPVKPQVCNVGANYSLFHGFWQSFVTIGSCNHLMRIISTYVSNTKESEIS